MIFVAIYEVNLYNKDREQIILIISVTSSFYFYHGISAKAFQEGVKYLYVINSKKYVFNWIRWLFNRCSS